jgi:superfamily II DNA/RNA helicase
VIERVIAPNDAEWANFEHKGMPQVLIVVPTRELCTQVTKDIEELASNRGIRTLAVYGGRAFEPQIEALQAGIEIVVGTPGRLLDLSRQGQLRLKQVSRLVLDEADEMLDLGFLPDVEKILANTPNRMQTMLFSATMPGDIIALARRFMNQPIHIRTQDSEDEGAVVTRIKQHVLRAHAMDKIEMLARILQAEGRGPTMVFCRTKRTCQKTAEDLMERGFKAAPIHGDLGQSAREKALGDFKAGKSDVLVATDVAARGIDIDGITHVINYQCPEDEKTYVHRIGRTARAGAHGIAVTFVDWDELARWKMINQVLDLGLAEPEETYSSSPHLYEVLDIPAGSTGRLTKSKPVVQQKAVTEKRVEKRAEPKPKIERNRTRTKKFKES